MDETTVEIKEKSFQQSLTLVVIKNFLIALLCTIAAIIVIRYYLKRNRINRISVNINGPKSYPIIGSAHLFAGSTEGNFSF